MNYCDSVRKFLSDSFFFVKRKIIFELVSLCVALVFYFWKAFKSLQRRIALQLELKSLGSASQDSRPDQIHQNLIRPLLFRFSFCKKIDPAHFVFTPTTLTYPGLYNLPVKLNMILN